MSTASDSAADQLRWFANNWAICDVWQRELREVGARVAALEAQLHEMKAREERSLDGYTMELARRRRLEAENQHLTGALVGVNEEKLKAMQEALRLEAENAQLREQLAKGR